MINYFFEGVEKVDIDDSISTWIKSIISSENKKLGEINYIFGDDEYILKVNQEYLQHDFYTDVITFDYVKGKTISADIFVSLPRISENAKTFNKEFNLELYRVLAHGILHLIGYKDKSESEILEMRFKEDYYLNLL